MRLALGKRQSQTRERNKHAPQPATAPGADSARRTGRHPVRRRLFGAGAPGIRATTRRPALPRRPHRHHGRRAGRRQRRGGARRHHRRGGRCRRAAGTAGAADANDRTGRAGTGSRLHRRPRPRCL
ncbi:MAG: hypothetical protein F4X99_22330, partial [Gammaproteobacteria bacterium]|nr:hypothetical protein [Gammaproteobacteria bacterium]